MDKLVQTFDYKERPQVFEYYPQYYHKTDKVGISEQITSVIILTWNRTGGLSISNN